MVNSISGIVVGKPVQNAEGVAAAKPQAQTPIPQPKDTVTISAKGQQAAVPLRTAGSTPAEEAKESPIARALEASQGKK